VRPLFWLTRRDPIRSNGNRTLSSSAQRPSLFWVRPSLTPALHRLSRSFPAPSDLCSSQGVCGCPAPLCLLSLPGNPRESFEPRSTRISVRLPLYLVSTSLWRGRSSWTRRADEGRSLFSCSARLQRFRVCLHTRVFACRARARLICEKPHESSLSSRIE
jgi:hypothetical protein